MVDAFRDKWCDDLEDLMKCPVCFERLHQPIAQCQRGHQICTPCRNRLKVGRPCPFCDATYNHTRNYLAETLSEKLDEIKISLRHPEHSVNQIKLETISVQTDDPVIVERNLQKLKLASPPAPKGKFPCRIDGCEHELPHGRMIPHIRYHHKNKFYESSAIDTDTYTQVWEMDYQRKDSFDLAVRISNFGLFFMTITINPKGDLFGIVQIVNSAKMGRGFQYKLKVGSGRRNVSFQDVVRSCRLNPSYLFESSECLVIRHEDMELMTARNMHTFTCTMVLTRLGYENRLQSPPSNSVTIF